MVPIALDGVLSEETHNGSCILHSLHNDSIDDVAGRRAVGVSDPIVGAGHNKTVAGQFRRPILPLGLVGVYGKAGSIKQNHQRVLLPGLSGRRVDVHLEDTSLAVNVLVGAVHNIVDNRDLALEDNRLVRGDRLWRRQLRAATASSRYNGREQGKCHSDQGNSATKLHETTNTPFELA